MKREGRDARPSHLGGAIPRPSQPKPHRGHVSEHVRQCLLRGRRDGSQLKGDDRTRPAPRRHPVRPGRRRDGSPGLPITTCPPKGSPPCRRGDGSGTPDGLRSPLLMMTRWWSVFWSARRVVRAKVHALPSTGSAPVLRTLPSCVGVRADEVCGRAVVVACCRVGVLVCCPSATRLTQG